MSMKRLILFVAVLFVVLVSQIAKAETINGYDWMSLTVIEKELYFRGYFGGAVTAYVEAIDAKVISTEEAMKLIKVFTINETYETLILVVDYAYVTGVYDKQELVTNIIYFELIMDQ